MIAVETDDKSHELREPFLKALRERRRMIEREHPTAWDIKSSRKSAKTRLRRFDLTVGSGRDDWEAVSLSGRSCAPVLSVSLPREFAGSLPDDPFERTLAILDVAERLSLNKPQNPEDEANELALAASFGLRAMRASVTLTRPTPWAPGSIEISSIHTSSGFRTFPCRNSPENFAPIKNRLDRLVEAASPRLAMAIACRWQANSGGGHSLIARPSTAGAFWRDDEHTTIDALRLCSSWARELAEANLA